MCKSHCDAVSRDTNQVSAHTKSCRMEFNFNANICIPQPGRKPHRLPESVLCMAHEVGRNRTDFRQERWRGPPSSCRGTQASYLCERAATCKHRCIKTGHMSATKKQMYRVESNEQVGFPRCKSPKASSGCTCLGGASPESKKADIKLAQKAMFKEVNS